MRLSHNDALAYFLKYVSEYLFWKCKRYCLDLLSVFNVSYRIAKCIREIVSTKGGSVNVPLF